MAKSKKAKKGTKTREEIIDQVMADPKVDAILDKVEKECECCDAGPVPPAREKLKDKVVKEGCPVPQHVRQAATEVCNMMHGEGWQCWSQAVDDGWAYGVINGDIRVCVLINSETREIGYRADYLNLPRMVEDLLCKSCRTKSDPESAVLALASEVNHLGLVCRRVASQLPVIRRAVQDMQVDLEEMWSEDYDMAD